MPPETPASVQPSGPGALKKVTSPYGKMYGYVLVVAVLLAGGFWFFNSSQSSFAGPCTTKTFVAHPDPTAVGDAQYTSCNSIGVIEKAGAFLSNPDA